MDDMLRSAAWIVIVAVLAAYTTYLIAGNAFYPSAPAKTPMVVRDAVRKNERHLTGTLHLSSTCEQLKASTRQVSKNVYELVFETWPDPAVRCERRESPRPFSLVVFAPSVGTHFIASLDKNPLSIAVYPTVLAQ